MCLVFDLWLLLMSVCSISLILPIHRLFEPLYIIFMKCLLWLKLFKMIIRTFWTNNSLYHPLFFTYLPFISQLHRFFRNLTGFLRNHYYGYNCLKWLVEHIGRCSFYTMSPFLPITSVICDAVFGIYPSSCNFVAFLSNLISFLRNDYHGWSCLQNSGNYFVKIRFWYHF